MIDTSIYFKVNSETDVNTLILLNNTIVKRVNFLRHKDKILKVEEVVKEPVIIKEIPAVEPVKEVIKTESDK